MSITDVDSYTISENSKSISQDKLHLISIDHVEDDFVFHTNDIITKYSSIQEQLHQTENRDDEIDEEVDEDDTSDSSDSNNEEVDDSNSIETDAEDSSDEEAMDELFSDSEDESSSEFTDQSTSEDQLLSTDENSFERLSPVRKSLSFHDFTYGSLDTLESDDTESDTLFHMNPITNSTNPTTIVDNNSTNNSTTIVNNNSTNPTNDDDLFNLSSNVNFTSQVSSPQSKFEINEVNDLNDIYPDIYSRVTKYLTGYIDNNIKNSIPDDTSDEENSNEENSNEDLNEEDDSFTHSDSDTEVDFTQEHHFPPASPLYTPLCTPSYIPPHNQQNINIYYTSQDCYPKIETNWEDGEYAEDDNNSCETIDFDNVDIDNYLSPIHSFAVNYDSLPPATPPPVNHIELLKSDKEEYEANMLEIKKLIDEKSVIVTKFHLKKKFCAYVYDIPRASIMINSQYNKCFLECPSYIFCLKISRYVNWEMYGICEETDLSLQFPVYFCLRSPYPTSAGVYYYISILGLHDFWYFNSWLKYNMKSTYQMCPIVHFEQFNGFEDKLNTLREKEESIISTQQLRLHVRRTLRVLSRHKILCKYKGSDRIE